MSYQAITDIITNQSQTSDFKLSAAVKNSPDSSPSVSFADILASYNEESKIEQPKASEAQKPDQAEKTEKTEKNSENQVEKEKELEKASENAVEKTDSKDSEEKIDDAAADISENDYAKAEIKDKTDVSEAAAKAGKGQKDLKKDKKLSEKEFSRLDELTEKTDAEVENAKLAAASQKLSETDKKLTVKDGDEKEIDFKIQQESSSKITLNEAMTDNKSETSDFIFSGNEAKGKKQFTLDKDGKITVEDLRTKIERDSDALNSRKSAVKTGEIKLTNDSTAVMSVELNPNAEADVLSLNNQTAASNGSNFQAMLSNQLSNLAPEFVKAGNLVLKDNNQGTINLVLHPDDLGNVKIHLSLDGKTLSGHITVATKEALQVFKDNAETLREAFIKNGFDAAGFDVSMNNGGSFNQSMGFEGQDDGTNMFAKRVYGEAAFENTAGTEDIFENIEDFSNYSVNIVA